MRGSLGRDPDTGRYRYASRYVHGSERDAQKAAAAPATEVSRGSHRHSRRHTVAELLDRWMDHIEAQGRAPTTMARYRSAISVNIKPRIGDLPISKVGPAELDGLYSQLARGVPLVFCPYWRRPLRSIRVGNTSIAQQGERR